MTQACDLKTLEQLSLKVVEASPDAKIVIDAEGVIVIFNQQAELMFGHSREDVIGEKIEMLLPERMREGHLRYREVYFESPSIREMGAGRVLLGLHKNGKEFPVQIKLAYLIVKSGIHALAVVRRIAAHE